MKTVVAHYDDRQAAEKAILELSAHGFERRHISTDSQTGANQAGPNSADPNQAGPAKAGQDQRTPPAASVRVTVDDDQLDEVNRLLEKTPTTKIHLEDAGPPPSGSAVEARERGAVGDSRPTADATTQSPAAGQMRPAIHELFQKHEPQFREHFREHGGSSESYDQYRQAYLEGTRLGTDFQSRDWSEVEQEGRRRWEHNQHSQPWAKVREYVKHGWGTRQQ